MSTLGVFGHRPATGWELISMCADDPNNPESESATDRANDLQTQYLNDPTHYYDDVEIVDLEEGRGP